MGINLLPWREKKRAQAKIRFFIMHALSVISSLFILFVVNYYVFWRLENQIIRNQILQSEINTQELKFKEIAQLKQAQQTLIARILMVRNLQTSRILMGQFLDELAKVIPSAVYLTKLERKNDVVTLWGHAEANASISMLMKNIEENSWMQNPVLAEIKKIDANSQPLNNEFQLSFLFMSKNKPVDSL